MDLRVVFILAALGIVQCKLVSSCKDVKKFVNGHNSRRLQLAKGEVDRQPAASRMTYLVWDEELAKKASNWASRNKYTHNPDKTIPSGRFRVGENIYKYRTTNMNFNFDPEQAMKAWWDEYKDFTYQKLKSSMFRGSKKIGHYTQMAWEDSTRIGCGISQYLDNKWNTFLVVCNYGPGGNVVGRTPYNNKNGASGHLVCGEIDCTTKYGDSC